MAALLYWQYFLVELRTTLSPSCILKSSKHAFNPQALGSRLGRETKQVKLLGQSKSFLFAQN